MIYELTITNLILCFIGYTLHSIYRILNQEKGLWQTFMDDMLSKQEKEEVIEDAKSDKTKSDAGDWMGA